MNIIVEGESNILPFSRDIQRYLKIEVRNEVLDLMNSKLTSLPNLN